MKAIVMAGGFGTRIQPLTHSIPKPMLPILNRPMMEHTIVKLKEAGITEFIVILYFKPDVIMNYFKDGSQFGINIAYVVPDDDYGTAGAVKKAQMYIGDENFIVISGDLVTDFDFKKIFYHHQIKKSKLSITLTTVDNPLEFGVVVADEDGRIQRFIEKPSWGEAICNTINTGIYIIEPEILDYIPKNENFDFAKDLFPLLLREGIELMAGFVEGYWRDVGNPESYREVHEDIFNNKIALKSHGHTIYYPDGTLISENNKSFDKSIDIIGSVVIGKNVTIEKGCKLKNVSIGDNVIIKQNSEIENSVIWKNVTIGSNAKFDGCIICDNNQIGKSVTAKSGMVLAESCKIGGLVTINKDITIWPYKVIEKSHVVSSNMVFGNRYKNSIFEYGTVIGQSNVELSCVMATKLAEAFATQLPVGSNVIVSRDYNPGSRMLKRAIVGGLLSAGVNVIDYNIIALSVMRYSIQSHCALAGGIHVNQFLNDPTRSVISFFDHHAHQINHEISKKIEKTFLNESFRRVDASKIAQIIESNNETEYEEYKNRVVSLLENSLRKGLEYRIAVDMMHGTASSVFPKMLNQIGIDHILFNPYQEEQKQCNIKQFHKDFQKVIEALKIDVGFMIYPDGQTFEIVCDRGTVLTGQTSLYTVLALLNIEAKAERRIKHVFLPVSTSDIVRFDHLNIVYGRYCDLTTEEMKVYDLIAVEDGTIAFTEFSVHPDAMYAALKILSIIMQHHVRISELVNSFPNYYYHTFKIPCIHTMKGKMMRKFLDLAKHKGYSTLDGIKIWLDTDDWILMVPDQHDQHLNLTIQAINPIRGIRLYKTYRAKIQKWLLKISSKVNT